MNWRGALHRTNLILGLISLGLALWGGMHLQHLLDDGGRHVGETVVVLALALLVFGACRYGAHIGTSHK